MWFTFLRAFRGRADRGPVRRDVGARGCLVSSGCGFLIDGVSRGAAPVCAFGQGQIRFPRLWRGASAFALAPGP